MKKILFACLILCSCKKRVDSTDPPPPPPPPATVNPVLVSAVLILDTTLPHPRDTIRRYYLSYDGQNRLSTIAEFDFESNGDTSAYVVYKYQYNGADSAASRLTSLEKSYYQGTIQTDYDTADYTYSNGRLLYDTTYKRHLVTNSYYRTSRTYAYNGSMVSKIEKTYSSVGNNIHTSHVYPILSGGNLISQLDSSYSLHDSARTQTTATYLPNLNPFRNYPIPTYVPIYEFDDLLSSDRFLTRNLPQQEMEQANHWGVTGSGNNTTIITYSYTFRPDGYPIKYKKTYVAGSNIDVTIGVIQYK
jgi:hypothetical protein